MSLDDKSWKLYSLNSRNWTEFDEETAIVRSSTLLDELAKQQVNVPSWVGPAHLKNGFGDAVCNIVNDLMNIELMRRDFRFIAPSYDDEDGLDVEIMEEDISNLIFSLNIEEDH